jgi:hypothetical protein
MVQRGSILLRSHRGRTDTHPISVELFPFSRTIGGARAFTAGCGVRGLTLKARPAFEVKD